MWLWLNSFVAAWGSLSVRTTCSVPQMPEQARDDPAATLDMDLRELVQRHQTGIWRYLRTLGASNIEKATVSIKQEAVEGKIFTEAEKKACSIEAMMNGEECEACQ